jgi:hypothetical protein
VRVSDLRREATATGSRVVARVRWEDADLPARDLHFEVDAPHDAELEPRPSAFLVALAWPALSAGERRIAIDGPVCPRLAAGVVAFLRVVRGWRLVEVEVPTVEPSGGFVAAHPARVPRTAAFLSGGVDSLDLLRENGATFPADHPLRVREAIFVHGLDIGSPRQSPRLTFFERARETLVPVARSAGVSLVVARTNVRAFGRDWAEAWFAAGTVAVAHALDARLTDALLASSYQIDAVEPCGSHPMTDPLLSSGALEVRHEGATRARLQKLAAVLDWPEARAALRVCWQDVGDDGPMNCGRCRKCVRTRLAVEALGRLGDAPTLPAEPLGLGDLDACAVDALTVPFYEALLGPLRARGRGDLAALLGARLDAFRALRPSWPRRLGRLVGLR